MTHPTIHYGKCALCRNDAELQESHAIPDAIFRRLFSKGSGSAIVLDNDPDQRIYQSQDSWADRLLCKACESRLNVQYDIYGDQFSKGLAGIHSVKHESTRIEKIDKAQLRMFFLSVVWRMGRSHAVGYGSVVLPATLDAAIAHCMLHNTALPREFCTVRIWKFRESKEFADEKLEVTTPWMQHWNASPFDTFRAVEFVFAGYFVAVIFPGFPPQRITPDGILDGPHPTLTVPHLDLMDVPELLQLMVVTMDKHQRGHMTKSLRKKFGK